MEWAALIENVSSIGCLLRVWVCVTQSCRTLRTVAHQAPLSVGFFRQKCWSGLLFLLQEWLLSGDTVKGTHCLDVS